MSTPRSGRGLFLLLFLFAAVSCVTSHDPEGTDDGPPANLEILANQKPNLDCTLSSSATDAIESGTFDLVIGDRSSYVLTPLVANNTDFDITISAAHVFVNQRDGDRTTALRVQCEGGRVCSEWELPVCEQDSACPVVPAHGTASFEVDILPRVLTTYFQGMMDSAAESGQTPPQFQLISLIELEGVTSRGAILRSERFSFPVRLCLGCLVAFPVESDDPQVSGEDCCGEGGELQPSCYPAQDEPVDCRECTRTSPFVCNFGLPACG